MTFENHPVLSVLAGLAATSTLAVLAATVSNPFLSAGLVGASLLGGIPFGFGLAELLGGRSTSGEGKAGTARSSPAAGESPALSPPANAAEIRFADRLRSEPLYGL
jgi:hypothetical protein